MILLRDDNPVRVGGIAASTAQIFTCTGQHRSEPWGFGRDRGSAWGVPGTVLYPAVGVDSLLFLGISFTKIRVPAFVLLGFWIGSQFISHLLGSMTMRSRDTGCVAYMAHIGGLIFIKNTSWTFSKHRGKSMARMAARRYLLASVPVLFTRKGSPDSCKKLFIA